MLQSPFWNGVFKETVLIFFIENILHHTSKKMKHKLDKLSVMGYNICMAKLDNIIEVEHFKISFAGKTVIKDLSFNVKRGEIFGLLGSNGSGKTTTLYSAINEINVVGDKILTAEKLLRIADDCDCGDAYDLAVALAGQNYCTVFKVRHDLELNKQDKDYIVEHLA